MMQIPKALRRFVSATGRSMCGRIVFLFKLTGFVLSSLRKQGSRVVAKEWIAAFAGMTEWDKRLVDQGLLFCLAWNRSVWVFIKVLSAKARKNQ